MKPYMLKIIVALLLLPVSSVIAVAQSQAEMNKTNCDEYAKADAELNMIYQQVLRERRSDVLFTRKMRAAQRAWVAYRNAHLAALYPAANSQSEYGSVYPMCRCTALTEATSKRADELRRWAAGSAEEGDVCAGSRRAQTPGGGSTDVPEYERADSVFRKRWTLTAMGERSFTSAEPYLEFNVKQGRFSGSSGCNRVLGGYRVDSTALKFSAVAGTRRACPGEEDQIERSFLKAIETTTRFQVEGDVVRLYANNSPVLTFKASGNLSANEGSNMTQTAKVTGTIAYRQRIALTPSAVVDVKLVDVSRADAPSVTIAEQTIKPAGRQVPIAFELSYDPTRIEARNRYAVQVRILENGSLRFLTTQSYPVITGGNPSTVKIIVNQP